MNLEVPDYTIRLMKKEEIPQVLELWRSMDFTEGTYSVYSWYEYDPKGFYVAVTSDGTVLGHCAGILQHNDLAFIGMYVVMSRFQHRGIGRDIWNKVMERVGDRNAGVNPVPEQLANYRDLAGFSTQADWCSVFCIANEVLTSEMLTVLPDIDVTALKPEDSDAAKDIAKYDANLFGFSRQRLISIMCREKDTVIIRATNSDDKSVCGYGIIKQNVIGNALVGPLFADNNCIAEVILHHLVKSFPTAEKKGVTVISVDCNEDALSMLEKFGFEQRFKLARLYRSKEVNIPFKRVFAQTTDNFSVF